MSPSPERFAAIVPIRSWTTGKSRLGLDDDERASLARAFALDVVDVLKESPDIDLVVVVTSDDDVRAAVAGRRGRSTTAGRGLNDAVAQGCDHAMAQRSVAGRRRPVRPAVPHGRARWPTSLAMSEGHAHAYCPDAEGDGTSLVVSRDPSSLVTSYGPGSAAAHRAAGLVPLLGAPPEARRDVDTLAHLRDAESLGVGRHTAAALAEVSGSDVTSTRELQPVRAGEGQQSLSQLPGRDEVRPRPRRSGHDVPSSVTVSAVGHVGELEQILRARVRLGEPARRGLAAGDGRDHGLA